MKKGFKMTIGALALSLSVMGAGVANASEKGKEILNVAHRGASGHAPEHTITSYKMGEKMHGDYIEIDLQMTKDGHLIAMHDETLDRTTNGTGQVKDHTLEEIKKLDAGSWFNEENPDKAKKAYKGLKVPTLEEVFKKFGKNANYYIETKSPEVYPGMEEELIELVNKYGINKETLLVQSFSPESLTKMNQIDPSVKLVQLMWYTSPAEISDGELEAIKKYAIGIGPNSSMIDQEYVQKTVEHGLEIHPYTVNEKDEMKKLIDWGVTGIFTNFPDRLHELKKEND
ncbi:putative glycerophosphoryl diester phosphodiesterase 1 [Bacillus sp. THAF10]|uniref:glycerophosphodiester phosphodiesterase n=1 Tax=Bacillus sp. THAF10 TaxID=2587848 RepID=UPI001267DDB9|nr:glycerophosphodiester phosphodiesterase [Bacillus sp. THAF10]QFT89655.1 putative glycerophosphoryl diester phosphodiesterase 1 [Bacillus sp. THAF10]